jgi:hypothetical protein
MVMTKQQKIGAAENRDWPGKGNLSLPNKDQSEKVVV